jgi:hypothetical protein
MTTAAQFPFASETPPAPPAAPPAPAFLAAGQRRLSQRAGVSRTTKRDARETRPAVRGPIGNTPCPAETSLQRRPTARPDPSHPAGPSLTCNETRHCRDTPRGNTRSGNTRSGNTRSENTRSATNPMSNGKPCRMHQAADSGCLRHDTGVSPATNRDANGIPPSGRYTGMHHPMPSGVPARIDAAALD